MSVDRNAITDIRQRRAIQQLAASSLPSGGTIGMILYKTGPNTGDYTWLTGVYLQSPDGNWWAITIDNAGAMTSTNIGTTFPPP